MKKRFAAIAVAAVMLLVTISGCSNPDGKKLLEDAAAKQESPKAIKMGMKMDIDLDVSSGSSLGMMSNQMAMDMQMDFSPTVSHLFMSMNAPSMMGISMEEDSYFDNNTGYMYIKNNSGWRKAKAEASDSFLGLMSLGMSMGDTGDAASMDSMTNMTGMFNFAKDVKTLGKKDFNNINCYEIEITMDPEMFKSLISMAMMSTGEDLFGDMSEEDSEIMANALADTKMYVYVGVSDGLMHGTTADAGGFIKALLDSMSASEAAEVDMKKSVFEVSLTYDYKDDAIKLPGEAEKGEELDDLDELLRGSIVGSMGGSSFGGSDLDDDIFDDGLTDDSSDGIEAPETTSPSPDSTGDEATTPPATGAVTFSDISMVSELSSSKIGDEVDTYKPTDKQFFVVASVSNVGEPIKVYIDWYQAGDPDRLIDSVTIDMDADNVVTSTLTPDTEKWPTGDYYVEFSASKAGDDKDTPIPLGSSNNKVEFTVE